MIFTCGLAGAIASNPVDVVRTRMMNQRAIVGNMELYKGTLDGLVKVRRCTRWADPVLRSLGSSQCHTCWWEQLDSAGTGHAQQ